MRIILNGSIDLYEDGIDFEDLEIEIVNECDIDECDIEDYMMDCEECGFCELGDEEVVEYDDETVKNAALYELLDYMFTLFKNEQNLSFK